MATANDNAAIATNLPQQPRHLSHNCRCNRIEVIVTLDRYLTLRPLLHHSPPPHR